MTGCLSTKSPSSTRKSSSGQSRRRISARSNLRNGSVPKAGSSATSRLRSTTAGSGSTDTDTAENFTGRPRALEAVLAMRPCTRGVSTRKGTAISAAIASTTTTPTPTATHRADALHDPSEVLIFIDRPELS